MSQAVICIAPTVAQANEIVAGLKDSGFNNSDISILLPDKNVTQDFGFEKHSKASEGTATGASTGAVLGGALGWLVGVGTLAIPGVGPFIAAGPIMAMLGGVAIGGSMGGIVGGLISIFSTKFIITSLK